MWSWCDIHDVCSGEPGGGDVHCAKWVDEGGWVRRRGPGCPSPPPPGTGKPWSGPGWGLN